MHSDAIDLLNPCRFLDERGCGVSYESGAWLSRISCTVKIDP